MPGEMILVIDDSRTILKVVSTNLQRAGYEVMTARDGREGIAVVQQVRPQMILLDLIMPNMGGVDFCRALQEMDDLSRVPVVLMSAKGDRIGDRFIKSVGAVDSITKPFSPEALFAVTQHVLSKYRDGLLEDTLVEHVRAIGIEELEPLEDELDEVDTAPLSRRTPRYDEQVVKEVAEQLAGRVTDILTSAIPELGSMSDEIEEALTNRFTPKALETIGSTVAQALPKMRTADLAGDLSKVPVADVLRLLQVQGQSGCTSITGDRFTTQIYFKEGAVALAQSHRGPGEFRLGRFMVEDEIIVQEDLELLLRDKDDRALLGQRLVKRGYLSQEELSIVLERQTTELIYETLRWPRGSCEFRRNVISREAELGQLGLSMESILMEGFRRVDEWREIEQKIDDFDEKLLPNEPALESFGREQLTQEERVVLDLINGQRSINDLVEMTQMGSFLVCKILYRLLSVNLALKSN